MTTIEDDLRGILGERGWLGPTRAVPYSSDVDGRIGATALGVARPASTVEVAAVVTACADRGIPIVPQGGNTGLSGASIPAVPGVVILSTARLNRVGPPQAGRIESEAGATITSVREVAAASGSMLGMDWGAAGTATVGGAVSTDAGGINVLAFGTTRDQVLGLEVVLADGSILNTLSGLTKDSTGPGIQSLFVGAEGTLGIVTRAALRLYPGDRDTVSFTLELPSVKSLPELYQIARRGAGGQLRAFELAPTQAVADGASMLGLGGFAPPGPRWTIIGRLGGPGPVGDTVVDLMGQARRAGLITGGAVFESQKNQNDLWRIREVLPPKTLYGTEGAKFDPSVPPERIGDYIEAVERAVTARMSGHRIYSFGHVGDGNIHLYVLTQDGSPITKSDRDRAVALVDEITIGFGGSISAEHGLGRDLLDRYARLADPVELAVQRSIKSALDPRGVMNPGVGPASISTDRRFLT